MSNLVLPGDLRSLLQKRAEKPNLFISTFIKEVAIGIFTINVDDETSLQSSEPFKKVFNWIKEQNSSITIHLSDFDSALVQQLISFLIREYSDFVYALTQFKQSEGKNCTYHTIDLVVDDKNCHLQAFEEALILANYINEAKTLGNLPSNVCTPRYLANFVKQKAEALGVNCSLFTRKEIESLGMHAFLSVAKGSIEEPYFIQLEYHGYDHSLSSPIVLVGKGITFDSGGISLKPALNMESMKFDMCGAAAVLMAFFAAVELKLPINLVALVPSCENMPSGSANKPGDIIYSLKGLSIEVLNTDAEGRLILCDALTYAERYKPAAVIDVATLTGACVIALGEVASGLLGKSQALINELLEASVKARDKAWQLPLWDEYTKALESPVADLANVAQSGGAGTVTAACFLSHFIDSQYPWAHLDVAGSAWGKGKSKSATARPLPLLIHFLQQRARET